MTIDNLFGNEKTVHLNRREYNIEKVEQYYPHRNDEVIEFKTSSYSPLNATVSRECPSYGVVNTPSLTKKSLKHEWRFFPI